MNKIEKLIQQLCPDGVEYKHLWEVTTWDKRFNAVENYKQPQVIKYKYFLASELKPLIVEGGTIKILTTNNSNLYTTEDLAEENYSEGEIIAIPWGGNPIVQYFNGKFLTSDNRIAVSNDTSYLNTKYLYYCLLDSIDIISTFYRGSGIKHPNMAKVLDFQIPIPPLPIQQEIVTILDKFTQLEAELEAELEARSRQYEYYRNQLLSFEGKDIEWKALGELTSLITKGTTPKKYTKNGIAFIKTEAFDGSIINTKKLSYIDYETHNKELKRSILKHKDILITIAGATIGKCAIVQEEILPANTNQALAIIRLLENINNKYIFYILKSNHMVKYIEMNVKGSAQPNLNLQQLNDFKIPIPSLEEQERIVNILDQFDALVNDIKTGLPAEITARRAQYEYYRKKLLTFQKT